MKKWLAVIVLTGLVVQGAGCANVQKKFIRKKKEPKHIPTAIYFHEGPYQKKFSNDYYYKTHYTMWKSWQDELLLQLGGNHKKVERCAQEAYSHLAEMSRYLTPEAQAALKPELESLGKISKQIDSGQFTHNEGGSMRVEIERIYRNVSNNFYYEKVKDKLLPDNVDLGASQTSQS